MQQQEDLDGWACCCCCRRAEEDEDLEGILKEREEPVKSVLKSIKIDWMVRPRLLAWLGFGVFLSRSAHPLPGFSGPENHQQLPWDECTKYGERIFIQLLARQGTSYII